MVDVPKIQYTTDYDSFKLFPENRPISKVHVKSFVEDATFPEKFSTAPIVVDSNRFIIDGQHRWSAAKELQIPVYFIIDPTAVADDIRNRNKKNKHWDCTHYIHYYSDKNSDYKLIKDLRNEFEIPVTFFNAAIMKLCSYKMRDMGYLMKNGEMSLKGKGSMLAEFVRTLVPALKFYKSKYIGAYPLFTQAYINGFMTFFLQERELFDSILKKLNGNSAKAFPFTSTFEEARNTLRQFAQGPKKNNECEGEPQKKSKKSKKAKQMNLFVDYNEENEEECDSEECEG